MVPRQTIRPKLYQRYQDKYLKYLSKLNGVVLRSVMGLIYKSVLDTLLDPLQIETEYLSGKF